MDFVTSLQVDDYFEIFTTKKSHSSCQSLAGLGSEKDEHEMSYEERKALEKKRFE